MRPVAKWCTFTRRCSLFLVERRRDCGSREEDRCLVSKLFNVSANSTVDDCNSDEWRVPWGSGIVGHVANTGCPLNIPDAYQVYGRLAQWWWH